MNYRGLDVYGMAPSSSGGITVGEALNILSHWNLARESRAQALFQYLEASRLAFADRNAYIGDSDYVERAAARPARPEVRRDPVVPDQRPRADLAGRARATRTAPYGGCGSTAQEGTPDNEGTHTNHLVVADKWGNVVSYTNTIEQIAGSGMTVPGRGFLLNNEMTDFDFAPATPGAYDPNLPAAGKRPRSSMSPTIVLKNGKFDFAVGSPGGSTIITTVLQILLNHIDFGMSLPDAIWAPRVSQRNAATSEAEQAFYDSALAKTLHDKYGEIVQRWSPAHAKPLLTYIGDATGVQSLGKGATRRWPRRSARAADRRWSCTRPADQASALVTATGRVPAGTSRNRSARSVISAVHPEVEQPASSRPGRRRCRRDRQPQPVRGGDEPRVDEAAAAQPGRRLRCSRRRGARARRGQPQRERARPRPERGAQPAPTARRTAAIRWAANAPTQTRSSVRGARGSRRSPGRRERRTSRRG